MLRFRAVATCLILLLSASTLPAVEHPSELFSPDVSVVVRLKNSKATAEKVAAFADAIQPGFGMQVKAGAQALGQGISNPTLAGVDQEKDWWMGLYTSAEGEPTIVYVIPATDADAMKKAVEAAGEFTFITHETWGIYTSDAWTADNVKACIDGKTKPLVDSVNEQLRDTFDKGDLSLFINVAQLAKTYDENIQEAKDALEQQADNVPPAAQSIIEMYLSLVKPLFQAVDDSSGAVVALTVDKDGISLDTLATFDESSSTAKSFSAAKSEISLLNRLPQGGQAYVAMSRMPVELQQWSVKMMEASAELFDQDQDSLDRVKDAMRRMQKLKFGAMAGMFAIDVEGKDPGIRGASVTEMEQPNQMRLLTKELMSAQSELNFAGVVTRYDYRDDAETYGRYKADTLKVEQEFEENPLFDMGEIYKAIFGGDGMMSRLIYTDKQVIQTMGGGKDAMKTLLQRLNQSEPPTRGAAFQATRAALSKEADLLVMVDLPGVISRFVKLMLNSGALPDLPVNTDAFSAPEKESYFGLSVAGQERGVRVKVYLPAEQTKQSYLFGMQVFQAFMQFQGQFN